MREFKITERITLRNDTITRYLNEVSAIPMLTPEQEHEIAVKATSGDREAINKLVEANLRFVVSVAKMYQGGNASKFADLINEGNIGLIEAASDFDPTTGFKFISYAVWHVRKNMLKYLTNHSRHIRIPLNKVQALKKINEIESDLTGQLGRPATSEEVLEKYQDWYAENKGGKVKIENLQLAIAADNKVAALESPFNENDESSISPINIINGSLHDTDYIASNNNTRDMLLPYVDKLPSYVDRELVLMRNGFRHNGETVSFGEIGNALGYTAERMRQRYKLAIRRLQVMMRRDRVSIEKFV